MAALFLLIGTSAARAESVIQLAQGAEVRAEVISEKADRVFADLGFTVLAIPRDSILSMEEVLDEAEPQEKSAGSDLFRTASLGTPHLPVKELVEQIGGAVVLIRTPTGLGSGFIIHPDGYIITNDHVIAGERELSVTVFEETEHEMKKAQYDKVRIVAASSDNDLALLKIETDTPTKFASVPLGESDGLRQGQSVFAIGNPLGLERSVSQGIISLRNRLIGGRLYIQTTTQINPGNSGGPLFNTRGEVVGVNNMKIAAAGAEGLGFAIPANVLKNFLSNRDAFAFDTRNPNAGFLYNSPPRPDSD